MRLCLGIFCSFFCALRSKGSTGASLLAVQVLCFFRWRVCAPSSGGSCGKAVRHPALTSRVGASEKGGTCPQIGTSLTRYSSGRGHELACFADGGLCSYRRGPCSTKKQGVDLQMKTALVLALAGSATAFAPRSVSRPSVAVNGCVSSVRHTILPRSRRAPRRRRAPCGRLPSGSPRR